MSLHRFEAIQRLPVPRPEAWAFFSDPRNLALITPPELGFEITSDLPEHIHAGLIVTYRVQPFAGLPVTWVTEISHLVEGELFVDDQRLGPYSFWHHQHHFRDIAGGTEVRDLVHYALPLGPLGALLDRPLDRLLVEPRLRAIFEFRRGVLDQRFGRLAGPGGPAQAARRG
ncbi:MAG: SRPBCC family protein [Chloroflexi bacterium]|nr:SRPBCC family protein [Chloroflexota bacterium]